MKNSELLPDSDILLSCISPHLQFSIPSAFFHFISKFHFRFQELLICTNLIKIFSQTNNMFRITFDSIFVWKLVGVVRLKFKNSIICSQTSTILISDLDLQVWLLISIVPSSLWIFIFKCYMQSEVFFAILNNWIIFTRKSAWIMYKI